MSACPCEVLVCLALANIPFTLHMTPQCRFNYAHCTDEKMEPLRDYAICPDLYSEIMEELGLEPASGVMPTVGFLNSCFLLFLNFIQDINMVCFVWGDENSFLKILLELEFTKDDDGSPYSVRGDANTHCPECAQGRFIVKVEISITQVRKPGLRELKKFDQTALRPRSSNLKSRPFSFHISKAEFPTETC